VKYLFLTLCGAAAMTAAPAHAEVQPELPSAVATFKQVCLVPGVSHEDRVNVLRGLAGWQEDASASVDVPKLGISRAIEKNYSFDRVESVRQWSGLLDGRPVKFVLASFAGKVRYPHLCALMADGVENAMPYGRPLRDAFKEFGIGGKSVDLVHYYEFAGKVGADRHPVRGEVFSRSLAGRHANTMHIYIAY
jgi:hypothetical protein